MNPAEAAHALTTVARLRAAKRSAEASASPLSLPSNAPVSRALPTIVCESAHPVSVSLQKDSAQRLFVKRVREAAQTGEEFEKWRPNVYPACVDHPLDDVLEETVTAGVARVSKGLASSVRADLELIPKAYEDSQLRAPNEGESECAREGECQGAQLAAADRCPDWPDNVAGFALVVFCSPQERSGERKPAAHGLCLMCLRFDTTTAWLRATAAEAPVADIIQPHRNTLGVPGEYSAHAAIPRASGRFSGITDPFIIFSRTKYAWAGPGRLRQRGVDFRRVSRFLSAQSESFSRRLDFDCGKFAQLFGYPKQTKN